MKDFFYFEPYKTQTMESNYTAYSPQENLLDDMDVHLVRAGAGQRFANYIIDYISFIIFLVLMALVLPGEVGYIVFVPFVPYVLYGLYSSTVEALTKGKSLGKLITGTRAVRIDGSPISAGTAFQRGFSRLVPFEAFSALGDGTNPWHDRWTDTYVIVEKESRDLGQ